MDLGNVRTIYEKAVNQEVNAIYKFNNSSNTLSAEEIMKLREQNKCLSIRKSDLSPGIVELRRKIRIPVVFSTCLIKVPRGYKADATGE